MSLEEGIGQNIDYFQILSDHVLKINILELEIQIQLEITWQHVLDPLFGYLSLAEKLSTGVCKYCDGWNFGPENNANTSVKEIIEIIKLKGLKP